MDQVRPFFELGPQVLFNAIESTRKLLVVSSSKTLAGVPIARKPVLDFRFGSLRNPANYRTQEMIRQRTAWVYGVFVSHGTGYLEAHRGLGCSRWPRAVFVLRRCFRASRLSSPTNSSKFGMFAMRNTLRWRLRLGMFSSTAIVLRQTQRIPLPTTGLPSIRRAARKAETCLPAWNEVPATKSFSVSRSRNRDHSVMRIQIKWAIRSLTSRPRNCSIPVKTEGHMVEVSWIEA